MEKIKEIVDGNSDLIGADAIPKTGSDLETQAKGTSDYNQKIGTQPYRYDMMGRFGFTLLPFYENKESQSYNDLRNELAELMYEKFLETLKYYYKHPNKLKSDYRINSETSFEDQDKEKKKIDFEWANKIIDITKPHFEKILNEPQKIDEDTIVTKKNEMELTKASEDNDIRTKKIMKIAGLINKLDKNDVKKIANLLEVK